MHMNEPFWPESLKVRILLYFAHANKLKMANYKTYKRIYRAIKYERGLLESENELL